MTNERKIEKESYTQKLIRRLQLVGTPESTINSIRDFALEIYDERQKEQAETAGTAKFGKYKGKKYEDIAKIDTRYITWMNKSNQYLSEIDKAIVADLCKGLKE
jgi:hypothetical protein